MEQGDVPPPPPSLGAHCTVETCKQIDFLPLQCRHCLLTFCKDHATPASHSCANFSDNIANNPGTFETTFASLLPDRASTIPAQREAEERASKRRKDDAQAVLEKNFGTKAVADTQSRSAASAEVKKALKEKPMSPVVALMKLKGRAKQGDPRKGPGDVKVEDRWYFIVKLCEGEDRTEKGMRELWLPKTTPIGKALDLFAEHFAIQNINNTTTDPAKVLHLYSPTFEVISTSTRIDAAVPSAGTLVLLRGPAAPS